MEKTIRINLKKELDQSYMIIINHQFFPALARQIKKTVPASLYVIVTDSNVAKHHLADLSQALNDQGLVVKEIIFPAGEKNKSRGQKEKIEDQLLREKTGRDACLIALGGGVTGDLTGFIAATYQRGIPFVQIPTTLLAQVDSSIGGKVAVDTGLAKNMIGAFYQPAAVFIDTATLATLPGDLRFNGIAEVIKTAVIKDENLFYYLENQVQAIKELDPLVLAHIIDTCCQIKANVVEEDEKEHGIRKLLNLGHTLGHAIEVLMDFEWIHDRCVALGLCLEADIAREMGLIRGEALDKITHLLKQFYPQLQVPAVLKPEQILEKTYLDKKVRHNQVEYVLPTAIGRANHGFIVNDDLVLQVLNSH